MATLREYFDTDFPAVSNIARPLTLTVKNPAAPSGGTPYYVPARAHCDFDTGCKFVSYFIPSGPHSCELCEGLVANPEWLFEAVKGVGVQTGYLSEPMLDAADLKFSGRIFLYTEDLLPENQMEALRQTGKAKGFSVVIRTPKGAQERSSFEKPLAFISHDSRDKDAIARPIALGLSKKRCPVWFDEYSLKVGDNLRTSIERGLKECKKCVLVLSPNFLKNSGWTRTEFDSVFTRQMLENLDVVLPVWCGVTKEQVYEFSPSLALRVAVLWQEGEGGLNEVLRKLLHAIEPPITNYTSA
jgi:hypothetical protein